MPCSLFSFFERLAIFNKFATKTETEIQALPMYLKGAIKRGCGVVLKLKPSVKTGAKIKLKPKI